jgi:hypothetical protein
MRDAQLASLVVLAVASFWYVAPFLSRLERTQALTVLLWVHVFRYVALFTISAQHNGYPISDAAVQEIVVGDLTGATIALLSILFLRAHSSLGLVLGWVLCLETILDFAVGIHRKIVEPSSAEVQGVLWAVLAFFVPAVIVSVPLLIWQLYSRRGDPVGVSDSNVLSTR